jgi:DNA-directed RNA polymerase specialized sigma24 family protein
VQPNSHQPRSRESAISTTGQSRPDDAASDSDLKTVAAESRLPSDDPSGERPQRRGNPATVRTDLLFGADRLIDLKKGDEITDAWNTYAAAGFDGPEWTSFKAALTRGTWKQLFAMLRDGRLERKAIHLGIPREHLEGDHPGEPDLDDVALDVRTRAMRRLQDDARKGTGWRPGRDTTPATYFINTCALVLRDAFRAWRRTRERERRERPHADMDEHGDAGPHPTDFELVDNRQTIRAVLDAADVTMRQNLLWYANGVPDKEIARRHRCSVSTVQRRRRDFLETIRLRGI